MEVIHRREQPVSHSGDSRQPAAGILQSGFLRAAEELAPEWVEVQFFDIGTVPFF